ncbi:hypothetical protein OKA05_12130 [Luteolibacter arcticus]|uniref:Uncharacterized protein n=1 Tax=Luteolibacter arcticus TaxID=1581411 RepID=A0ABT3GII1_9BACT|nr:hypothetical protein [Luteolibacter arcticus]MCW1923304.1 hypothetical protein [Luteolibacter arcticus]
MNRSRPARVSLPLFLFSLLLAGSAERALSEEILHIAIFGSGHREEVGEELKRRAGNPELPGERAVMMTREGKPTEDLLVHWQLPLSSEVTSVNRAGTPLRGGERKSLDQGGTTLEVRKAGEGDAAHLLFDIDTLEPALDQSYYRFRTSGLAFPLCPNTWQQVTDWQVPHHQNRPIWCYLESPQAAAGAAKAEAPPGDLPFGNDPKAPWRLEVRYGSLPDAMLEKIEQADPQQAALAAETMGRWFSYGIVCLSDQPFRVATGAGKLAKIKNEDYHDRRLAELEGTLTVVESNISLKCEFHSPAVREKDARAMPFEGELRPGEWKFQRIPDGPDHESMGEFPGGPSIKLNALPPIRVAAFRVTKLEVKPSPRSVPRLDRSPKN